MICAYFNISLLKLNVHLQTVAQNQKILLEWFATDNVSGDRLQPTDKPFSPKVLPVCPERTCNDDCHWLVCILG